MNINELKEERLKLEGALAEEIGKLVNIFEQKTTVSVKSISVTMLNMNNIGAEEKYMVQNVSCELAF